MCTRRPAVLLMALTIWCAALALRGASLAAQQGSEAVSTFPEIPAGDGSDTLRANCLTCHGTALITQQRLAREAWSRELDKMIGWGAVVPADQRSGLLKDRKSTRLNSSHLVISDALFCLIKQKDTPYMY